MGGVRRLLWGCTRVQHKFKFKWFCFNALFVSRRGGALCHTHTMSVSAALSLHLSELEAVFAPKPHHNRCCRLNMAKW